MDTATPPLITRFVSSATLARMFCIDPRTFARRIEAAGLTPDAEIVESTGKTALWALSHERIAQVGDLVRTGHESEIAALLSAAASKPFTQ
jgi:hypothetical protein